MILCKCEIEIAHFLFISTFIFDKDIDTFTDILDSFIIVIESSKTFPFLNKVESILNGSIAKSLTN